MQKKVSRFVKNKVALLVLISYPKNKKMVENDFHNFFWKIFLCYSDKPNNILVEINCAWGWWFGELLYKSSWIDGLSWNYKEDQCGKKKA